MSTLKKLVSNTKLLVSGTEQVNPSDNAQDSPPSRLRKLAKHAPPPSTQRVTSASHSASFIQDLKRKALRRQTPRPTPLDNFTRWDTSSKGDVAVPVPIVETYSPFIRGRFSWKKGATSSTLSLGSSSNPSRASTFSDSSGDSRDGQTRTILSNHGCKSPSAIARLDWNRMDQDDLEHIQTSFNRRIFDPSSPVDSAFDGQIKEPPTSKSKGKARVLTNAIGRAFGNPDKPFEAELIEKGDEFADHYRQIQEYERQQDENDLEYARELQREQEVKQRQREEEEERERLRLEEEDRKEAERLQEEERRLAEELARSLEVECVCCGTSKPPIDFSLTTPSAACEHPVHTCVECTHIWLATELESHGVNGLKCPECPHKLEYADVQRCASDETFAAYEKFLTRAALAAMPSFAWCIAPGCESGQVNEVNENYMKCQACNYQQCTKHQCAWHIGETCEAYDYRESGQKSRDDSATKAWLDEKSKLCPGKDCGWRIEKTDGCDHMTCRRCRHEFCWQCLASHTEIKKVGNTAHAKDCKFHSDNLAVAWPFNVH